MKTAESSTFPNLLYSKSIRLILIALLFKKLLLEVPPDVTMQVNIKYLNVDLSTRWTGMKEFPTVFISARLIL